MNDHELLELAAKAAGYKKYHSHYLGHDSFVTYEEAYYNDVKECQVVCEKTMNWNPLNDDGDALRLAVNLGLVVDCSRPSAGEPFKLNHFAQADFQDRNAATRRAIVRAAAEIGKAMP